MTVRSPKFSDWVPSAGNLDEAWAFKSLDGLSEEAALDLIKTNPSSYVEMLSYAKGQRFEHYLGLLADYLISEDSSGNFAAAAGFMDLLGERDLPVKMAIGRSGFDLSRYAMEVASRQSFYGADVDVMGDFRMQYEAFVKGEAT